MSLYLTAIRAENSADHYFGTVFGSWRLIRLCRGSSHECAECGDEIRRGNERGWRSAWFRDAPKQYLCRGCDWRAEESA